jgi:hypothetical protein
MYVCVDGMQAKSDTLYCLHVTSTSSSSNSCHLTPPSKHTPPPSLKAHPPPSLKAHSPPPSPAYSGLLTGLRERARSPARRVGGLRPCTGIHTHTGVGSVNTPCVHTPSVLHCVSYHSHAPLHRNPCCQAFPPSIMHSTPPQPHTHLPWQQAVCLVCPSCHAQRHSPLHPRTPLVSVPPCPLQQQHQPVLPPERPARLLTLHLHPHWTRSLCVLSRVTRVCVCTCGRGLARETGNGSTGDSTRDSRTRTLLSVLGLLRYNWKCERQVATQ